ncbi:MAG: ribose 5-phosphate isomerase B [Negativicutes bacterium]|nr:ribose 5-phosphate isomerase B [Negativicutes bacterium]
MKIAIGADNLGYQLKEDLKEYIILLGHEVTDCGCFSADPIDYPDVAEGTVEAITSGKCERGILICGTGIGMAMAANKVKGIRAAQCHDVYSAERAAKSNDAHIITLGALIVGPQVAKPVVKTWLESFFSGGPSAQKIEKIMKIEKRSAAV